ncbi:MAG: hypothetical protein ABIG90_00935 [bacterium]
MYLIQFTQHGKKDFQALDSHLKKRITQKLNFYAKQKNPLEFARLLINLPPATHRYRVGKYRIYFFIENQAIFVEKIEIRGRAYR